MRPLLGHRVVEVGQFAAGPFCGLLLADLGADVVKVEPPAGDETRRWGPPVGTESGSFLTLNRNKRGIALDWREPRGAEVLRRLLARADGLVENLRPGALERAGFGYQALSTELPRLIYVSISGYGHTGPYRERGGFDAVIQAASGLMSVTGEPDGRPLKCGVPVADFGAGVYGALAFLACLTARERSGRGQHADISMLDGMVSWLGLLAPFCWFGGPPPGRLGSGHPYRTPYQSYRTADGYIALAAGNERLWAAVCRAIGREAWLKEPRFADNAARKSNDAELTRQIEAVLAEEGTSVWVERLNREGVPCARVNSVADALADPQVRARGMVTHALHPDLGEIPQLNTPLRLSGATPAAATPAPRLGEHAVELLREAGYRDGEIAALLRSGVVAGAA